MRLQDRICNITGGPMRTEPTPAEEVGVSRGQPCRKQRKGENSTCTSAERIGTASQRHRLSET
jgi:hypothetical protein